MEDEPAFGSTPAKASGPWVWIAVLGVVLKVFWVTLFQVVPMQKKRFDALGVSLPWATKRLIDVASFFYDWWNVFVGGSVAAYVGLVVLTYANVLPKRTGRRLAQLATILLLACLVVMGLALSLPMIKVAEGLAK